MVALSRPVLICGAGQGRKKGGQVGQGGRAGRQGGVEAGRGSKEAGDAGVRAQPTSTALAHKALQAVMFYSSHAAREQAAL